MREPLVKMVDNVKIVI